jgi:hypothetical protein
MLSRHVRPQGDGGSSGSRRGRPAIVLHLRSVSDAQALLNGMDRMLSLVTVWLFESLTDQLLAPTVKVLSKGTRILHDYGIRVMPS